MSDGLLVSISLGKETEVSSTPPKDQSRYTRWESLGLSPDARGGFQAGCLRWSPSPPVSHRALGGVRDSVRPRRGCR
ncbi:hypothetical protein VPH35_129489 [Triticum aestivum]